MTQIKMPKLVWVQCSECGELDEVYWNSHGAIDNCPVCKSAPSSLFKVVK